MQRKALPWLRLPSSEGRTGFLPAVLQTRNRADYQRQYYGIFSTVSFTVQNRYLVPTGYRYRTPNFYCRSRRPRRLPSAAAHPPHTPSHPSEHARMLRWEGSPAEWCSHPHDPGLSQGSRARRERADNVREVGCIAGVHRQAPGSGRSPGPAEAGLAGRR